MKKKVIIHWKSANGRTGTAEIKVSGKKGEQPTDKDVSREVKKWSRKKGNSKKTVQKLEYPI